MIYACPKCRSPMKKQPGWAILHCISCNDSIDLWYDAVPEIINDEQAEEYDALGNIIIIPMNNGLWNRIKQWWNK